MDLEDSSAVSEHAQVVNNVVNGLLVMAEFASCSVYEAPFAQQIPSSSIRCFDAVDGGLASTKVKAGKFGGRVRNKIRLSDVGLC